MSGENETVKCRQKGISGSTLKIIAIISMIIDHTAMIFVHNETAYFIMRYLIGRMAFPIFCFLLVEGFCNTRSRANYAWRLFWFALISEIPFDLTSQYNFVDYVKAEHQNVFFTLLIGLFMMWGMELAGQRYLIGVSFFAAAAFLAEKVFRSDYGIYGIVVILVIYLLRYCPEKWQKLLGCGMAFIREPGALLALLPMAFYNGRRGLKLRLLFYPVYPLHLLLLHLLRQMLFQ